MYGGLGNNTRKTYAGLSNGKVVIRPGKDQEPIMYDHIEGRIVKINKADRTVNGKPAQFIEITLQDEKGEQAILSLYADQTSTRSILLSLASLTDFTKKVRIAAYPRVGKDNGPVFTNVAIRVDGEKLPWKYTPEQIPRVEQEVYKGQPFADPSKRNAFFDKIYDDIVATLANGGADGDDLPPVDIDPHDDGFYEDAPM